MNKQTQITPAVIAAAMNGDLDNALVAATPGGIEAQEAQGQQDFVNSTTLPKECPRKDLESLGFVFGEDDDDVFINAEMPEGWTKKPTDHSMWSDLLDEKGRKRGSIFYKAAFYDRSANLSLDRRYSVGMNYDLYPEQVQHRVVDTGDNNIVLFATEAQTMLEDQKFFEAEVPHEGKVEAWVKENIPEWMSPLAYWD